MLCCCRTTLLSLSASIGVTAAGMSWCEGTAVLCAVVAVGAVVVVCVAVGWADALVVVAVVVLVAGGAVVVAGGAVVVAGGAAAAVVVDGVSEGACANLGVSNVRSGTHASSSTCSGSSRNRGCSTLSLPTYREKSLYFLWRRLCPCLCRERCRSWTFAWSLNL